MGMLFSVISSLSLPMIKRKTKTNSDTLIGVFWATGMALGILFIGLTPGYPPDMTSYLFGDILTVSTFYLNFMIGLSLLVLLVVIGMFQYWKIYLFDEQYLKVLNIKTSLFEKILYMLIALSIVLLIKVVGMILAIAMLTIPPAIGKFLQKLSVLMVLATLIGLVISVSGLTLSYYFDIPSGATIILLAVVIYIGSYGFHLKFIKG